jgi:hypothetical protein
MKNSSMFVHFTTQSITLVQSLQNVQDQWNIRTHHHSHLSNNFPPFIEGINTTQGRLP